MNTNARLKKKRLKKKKALYSEPKKPEKGMVKYSTEVLTWSSDRYHYFPNDNNEDEDQDEENEDARRSRQLISLKEVNTLLNKEKISPDNVYFTVSLSDDNIVLEVVNIKELNYEEQLAEYEENKAEWEAEQKRQQEAELQRIQWDMENLQRRSEELKIKKR